MKTIMLKVNDSCMDSRIFVPTTDVDKDFFQSIAYYMLEKQKSNNENHKFLHFKIEKPNNNGYMKVLFNWEDKNGNTQKREGNVFFDQNNWLLPSLTWEKNEIGSQFFCFKR